MYSSVQYFSIQKLIIIQISKLIFFSIKNLTILFILSYFSLSVNHKHVFNIKDMEWTLDLKRI